jgi:hypothetical protein
MAGVSRANEGPDSITIKPLYGTFHAINRYVQDDVSLHCLFVFISGTMRSSGHALFNC